MPAFDAGTWLDTVETERPGSVFLVPAMAALLLEHPRFASADLGSVQLCTVGSAPLAPDVLERLQQKLPDALVSNNYGMTEAGSVYCMMPPGEAVRRPGSVGKPLPPAEILCTDADGRSVPPGEVGEVRMRIPGRPARVLRRPRGDRPHLGRRLAHDRRPRPDRRGRLPVHRRPEQGRDHPGWEQHPPDRRRARHRPPSRCAGGGRARCPPHGPGRGRRGLCRPASGRGHHHRRPPRHTPSSTCHGPRCRAGGTFVDALPRNATGKVVKDDLRRNLPDTEDGDGSGAAGVPPA